MARKQSGVASTRPRYATKQAVRGSELQKRIERTRFHLNTAERELKDGNLPGAHAEMLNVIRCAIEGTDYAAKGEEVVFDVRGS